MTAELNPKQALLLIALLGRGGSSAQGDMPFKVDAKDRKALERAGLVATQKRGRAFHLEVTDRGWCWANENLLSPLPSGRNATKAGTPVLQSWLERLHAYMQAHDVPLAEIVVPGPKRGAERGSSPPQKEQARYEEDRQRVRRAYLAITGGRFNDSVLLSRLRRELPEIDRETLDEALTRMHGEDEGTTLMNLANPRDIETERDAAIRIKGQDMHVLWISR